MTARRRIERRRVWLLTPGLLYEGCCVGSLGLMPGGSATAGILLFIWAGAGMGGPPAVPCGCGMGGAFSAEGLMGL